MSSRCTSSLPVADAAAELLEQDALVQGVLVDDEHARRASRGRGRRRGAGVRPAGSDGSGERRRRGSRRAAERSAAERGFGSRRATRSGREVADRTAPALPPAVRRMRSCRLAATPTARRPLGRLPPRANRPRVGLGSASQSPSPVAGACSRGTRFSFSSRAFTVARTSEYSSASVAEAHLRLGRMDVHVDLVRRHVRNRNATAYRPVISRPRYASCRAWPRLRSRTQRPLTNRYCSLALPRSHAGSAT